MKEDYSPYWVPLTEEMQQCVKDGRQPTVNGASLRDGVLVEVENKVLVWDGQQWLLAPPMAIEFADNMWLTSAGTQSVAQQNISDWIARGEEMLGAWRNDPDGRGFPVPVPPGFDEVAAFVFRVWAEEVQWNLVRVGFWEDGRSFGDEIAMLHSEASEALEAYRRHSFEKWLRADGKPEGVAYEFADLFIRLLDDCARRGWDLSTLYREKMNFNWTRSWRHGGRKL